MIAAEDIERIAAAGIGLRPRQSAGAGERADLNGIAASRGCSVPSTCITGDKDPKVLPVESEE